MLLTTKCGVLCCFAVQGKNGERKKWKWLYFRSFRAIIGQKNSSCTYCFAGEFHSPKIVLVFLSIVFLLFSFSRFIILSAAVFSISLYPSFLFTVTSQPHFYFYSAHHCRLFCKLTVLFNALLLFSYHCFPLFVTEMTPECRANKHLREEKIMNNNENDVIARSRRCRLFFFIHFNVRNKSGK